MSLIPILKILDIIIMSSDDSSTSELRSPVVSTKAPKVSIPVKASVSTKLPKPVKGPHEVLLDAPLKGSLKTPLKVVEEGLLAKLKDTNNIKYIVITVLLLGAVVYYVYTTKYKKDTNSDPTKQLPHLPIPKQNPSDAEVQSLRRQLLQKQEEQNHFLRERQQLVAELERERMNSRRLETFKNSNASLDLNLDMQNLQKEKPKRKLKHPNDNMDNIQVGESPLVAQHNLTQAEMEEISKKLSNLE